MPALNEPRVFSVSVTDLAAFCCRRGDLSSGPGGHSRISMDQGQEGQKVLQSQRPADYIKEKAVTAQFTGSNCHWVLRGRIDGIYTASLPPVIEEIKTSAYSKETLPDSVHELHLAQAKLYGALILDSLPDQTSLMIRVSYYQFHQQQEFNFDYPCSDDHLNQFLRHCVSEYGDWLDQYARYLNQRDDVLKRLDFPFEKSRQGQRQLSVQTYRDIRDGNQALYHAPTGLGKTIALLFPGIKSLAQGNTDQLWYLTAKGSGLHSVEHALEQLTQKPLQLRVCVLKAKEKQCPCEPQQCARSTGYYDRLPAARKAFQSFSFFGEVDLVTLAEQHQLCPHQLSRDLIPWADLIVADYNYVFDPYASLSESLRQQSKVSLLVDEAHNLPDRARQMYSEALSLNTLQGLYRQVQTNTLKQPLKKLLNQFRTILQSNDETSITQSFSTQLDIASAELMTWFTEQQWLLFPTEVFEQLMQLTRFSQRLHQLQDEDCFHLDAQQNTLEIHCLDPAPRLHKISKQLHSAHYFSGSLLPLIYYQRALSPEDFQSELVLPSPFPATNQLTLIYPINTRYQQRQRTLEELCQIIVEAYLAMPGRYLVTLPSYEYLDQVFKELQRQWENRKQAPALYCQPRSSDLEQRGRFLEQLQQQDILACVISGGLFAEGLDFNEANLQGVAIVGTCLAAPNPQGNRIQAYYQDHSLNGFDFAYRYPGMNRVIQSAGRVIRSEQHRGLVLLLDDRFRENTHRAMMPEHWNPRLVRSIAQLRQALELFATDNV